MCFCFKIASAGLAITALLSAGSPGPVPARISSTVRTDARSKRLVRVVTVTPAQAAGKDAKARPAGASQAVADAMADYVQQTAERYKVDPLLVHSVIAVESNYNPVAVSPKGAQGLMQLMPRTARQLEVKNSFNALENIDGGVRYLKYLLAQFGDQDPRLALAAYNAGENAVMRHKGVPPYPETVQYVQRVGKKYVEAKRAAGARAAKDPPPAPEYPPIEQYIDEQGRPHLRTRPSP